MKVYMLKDQNTGKFYQRHHGRNVAEWVDQRLASVWTQPSGPNACLGAITKSNYRNAGKPGYVKANPIIVILEVVEK